MPRAIQLLVVAVVLALTSIGLGSPPSTVAADVGHITGTVTGPAGQPLSGVAVYALTSEADSADWEYTDASGNYDLRGLEDGTYRLQALARSGQWLTEYWNDVSNYGAATAILVSGGETVSGKNFQLAAAGHIAGTVTGPNGQPLANTWVTSYAYNSDFGRWADGAATQTNAVGHYDVGGLATGTYRLEVASPSYSYNSEFWDNAATVEEASDISVTAGTTIAKDVQLASGGQISGRVTNATGEGIPGVTVTPFAYLAGPGGGWVTDKMLDTVTDGNGNYVLDGFGVVTTPGPISIRLLFETRPGHVGGPNYRRTWWGGTSDLASATTIPLAPEAGVTGKDIQLGVGGRITGTVSGPDGQPLSDVSVTLYEMDPDTHEWQGNDEYYTSEDGTYDFVRLETGVYRVGYEDQSGHHYYSELWNNAASMSAASDIHVTAGNTTTLGDVRLETSPPVPTSSPSPSSTPTASPTSEPTSTPTVTPTTPGKITAITKPKLKGKAKYGTTLKVSTGTWSPSKAKFHIRWLAGGRAIPRQTGTKLKLTGKIAKAAAGKALRVEIRVTAPGYATVTTALKVKGKVKLPKRG